MKFKKVSQGQQVCLYALVEDVNSVEYSQLVEWLNAHCPGAYDLNCMHLAIESQAELFFELTFELS